jgi:hypothetical protein
MKHDICFNRQQLLPCEQEPAVAAQEPTHIHNRETKSQIDSGTNHRALACSLRQKKQQGTSHYHNASTTPNQGKTNPVHLKLNPQPQQIIGKLFQSKTSEKLDPSTPISDNLG